MGIEVNYRTSTLKKEIIDTLIDIHIESSPVLIWQNAGTNRIITKGRIESIDFASDSIFLSPFTNEDDKFFELLKINSIFYLKGNTKSIVFKQDRAIKKTKKGVLQIIIPNIVKMFENRTESRMQLIDSKITADIYHGGQFEKSTKSKNVKLRDISLSGMGFFLESNMARFFIVKDKIKIDRIGNFTFPRPIYGEIAYSSAEKDNVGRIRIGIRFHEKLTADNLNAINS
jgi:hypothetical protein